MLSQGELAHIFERSSNLLSTLPHSRSQLKSFVEGPGMGLECLSVSLPYCPKLDVASSRARGDGVVDLDTPFFSRAPVQHRLDLRTEILRVG